MEPKMLGTHQGTYDAVFQHPIARNLQWHDVKSMLVHWPRKPRNTTAISNTPATARNATVHPPRRKDFSDVEELMQIRHFLERSGAPSQEAVAEGVHLLVVIDHRERSSKPSCTARSPAHHRLRPARLRPISAQRGKRLQRPAQAGTEGLLRRHLGRLPGRRRSWSSAAPPAPAARWTTLSRN